MKWSVNRQNWFQGRGNCHQTALKRTDSLLHFLSALLSVPPPPPPLSLLLPCTPCLLLQPCPAFQIVSDSIQQNLSRPSKRYPNTAWSAVCLQKWDLIRINTVYPSCSTPEHIHPPAQNQLHCYYWSSGCWLYKHCLWTEMSRVPKNCIKVKEVLLQHIFVQVKSSHLSNYSYLIRTSDQNFKIDAVRQKV